MELNENNKTTYLEELNGSDFEIADHQPDITGWDIVDSFGNELGEVKDLIFDSQALKVRYVIADIDATTMETGNKESRKVLIPIGIVDLDENKDEVILSQFAAGSLIALPTYESGKTISPVEELTVRHVFLGTESMPDASIVVYEIHPEDFYTHSHFDDSRFNRRRPG